MNVCFCLFDREMRKEKSNSKRYGKSICAVNGARQLLTVIRSLLSTRQIDKSTVAEWGLGAMPNSKCIVNSVYNKERYRTRLYIIEMYGLLLALRTGN